MRAVEALAAGAAVIPRGTSMIPKYLNHTDMIIIL